MKFRLLLALLAVACGTAFSDSIQPQTRDPVTGAYSMTFGGQTVSGKEYPSLTPLVSGSTTAQVITSATSVTLSGTSFVKAVVQVTGTSTAYLALGSVTASATNSMILNAAAAVDTGGDSRTIDDYQGPISLGFAGGTGRLILTHFYK